ncbi:MAG: TlpA family protein disulfide reductase [Paracoccaceae bacterium]
MKKLFLVLYTALALLANAAAAEELGDMLNPWKDLRAGIVAPTPGKRAIKADYDPAAREALRTGEMQKLVFSETPGEPVDAVFVDENEAETALSEFRGDVVLLNFWATWCMPCREEMPSLDKVEAQFGDLDFSVVPVATGRNSVTAIEQFYDDAGIEDLPVLRDPQQAFAREMRVMGLPVSVILDCEGREIARLIGEADWAAPESLAMIEHLMGECSDD